MARAYPESLLAAFRQHLREGWMPKRSIAYFREQDPKAVEFVARLLPAAPPVSITSQRPTRIPTSLACRRPQTEPLLLAALLSTCR
jgi:hypothetical protein